MADRVYTRDGLVVHWTSKLCVHCEACWRGLPEVFNPEKRPWVNLEAAPIVKIVEQVQQCPSGALSIPEPKKG